MDRNYLAKEIVIANQEVQRLRDERARLPPGDREGAARFRALIDSAAGDAADLQAELDAYDFLEAGEARMSERARGRASAAQVGQTMAKSLDLWATLQTHLTAARQTAAALKALGTESSELANDTLRAHYGQDIGSLLSKGQLVVPGTAGSDSGTVEALAFELKALLEAMPGGLRLANEWLIPNYQAFSYAKPRELRPTLRDARIAAANSAHMHLSALCQEPPPIAVMRQRDEERHAEQRRIDARAVGETFGRIYV